MDHQLALTVLEESLAVCSLPPGYPLPEAIFTGSLSAVIQTEDEISLICRSEHIPHGATAVAGWRAFKVQGPLEFELTGVLASLALPLAQHGVSIFAIWYGKIRLQPQSMLCWKPGTRLIRNNDVRLSA
jgi:hypothetical protein